jgi:hypothetical protein
MRKRTIAIISLGAFAALCWTFIIFFSAFITVYRLFKWTAKSTERIVFVEKANLESEPGIRVLDANNPFFKVIRNEPNRVDVKWETDINLERPKCRVKQLGSTFIRVMGLLNDDKEYPVVIDSGRSAHLVVNDVVVLENGLDILPLKVGLKMGGFCYVAQIEIGDMAITSPPCFYALTHYEKQVLGLTTWKEKDIILGLGLMQKFKYVLIDNINSEVEFCKEGSFRADSNESWSQYPMSIEADRQNRSRLMVKIPIGTEERKIILDTGADGGLLITEKIWETFSAGLKIVDESSYRIRIRAGWNEVKKIVVDKLTLCEKSISNATIYVMNNNSKFGENFSLLGMGYFTDTTVVLDFGRKLFWVRNPQS